MCHNLNLCEWIFVWITVFIPLLCVKDIEISILCILAYRFFLFYVCSGFMCLSQLSASSSLNSSLYISPRFFSVYTNVSLCIYINTLKHKYFSTPVAFYFAVVQIKYLVTHCRYVRIYTHFFSLVLITRTN